MTVESVERGKLDIGRVFQQTFGVLGRNIVTFTVLGLVLSGIPTAIVAFLQVGMMRDQFASMEEGQFNFSASYFQAVGLSGLTAVVTSAILQGALIYTTVQDLNGQKAGIGDSLATGLRNFLPLIGVTILFVLAVMAGSILLFVPGIMIACAWCVVAPALVADRTGVFGAFSRAADLTRGNRWRIFGLALIVWAALVVIGVAFNAVSGVYTFASNPQNMIDRVTSPLFLSLAVIRQVITTVIGAAAISVLYVELRRVREGAAPQWLAEIFA